MLRPRRAFMRRAAVLAASAGVFGRVRAQVPAAPSRHAASSAQAAQPQASTARRIICVGGALTETIYALGAQGELVGVDTTSLYPPEAQQLPSVGYARTLSPEGVLSLRPTLVLASGEAGPPAVLRQLEAARVPVHLLDADHRIEGLVQRTRQLGALIGRADAAQALAAAIERDWQAAQARVAALRGTQAAGPRVLFILSHAMNQVRIGGSGTAADAVIRYAGARNAFGDVAGFKPLTPEAAIAAAPDVILATEQGLRAAGGIDGLLATPGLATTPAGRHKRVVAFEALFLLGFGPRLPHAVVSLAERLYGTARG
jgi:iron complex transport system substrate-binding protein